MIKEFNSYKQQQNDAHQTQLAKYQLQLNEKEQLIKQYEKRIAGQNGMSLMQEKNEKITRLTKQNEVQS